MLNFLVCVLLKFPPHLPYFSAIIGLDSKESACSERDLGLIPGLGQSPGRGHGNPLQYCLENPHEQRSPAGYSLWGHKELDMTERQSTVQWHILGYSFFFMIINIQFTLL